jgi:hypothetical protein
MDAETIKAIQYFRLECTVPRAVEKAEILIKALQKAEWNAVETAWSFVDIQGK